jgi:hypothetical protein
MSVVEPKLESTDASLLDDLVVLVLASSIESTRTGDFLGLISRERRDEEERLDFVGMESGEVDGDRGAHGDADEMAGGELEEVHQLGDVFCSMLFFCRKGRGNSGSALAAREIAGSRVERRSNVR